MKMIAGLLLLTASQQGSERFDRFELFNECRPVGLRVAGLPPAAATVGLTVERIRTLAESRLRAARLFSDDASANYLYINVNVVGLAFSHGFQLQKWVFDPSSGESGFATTWQAGGAGQHGRGGGGFIMQILSEQLDTFLLEYLRVNEEACR